jgi:hypothetical protein
MWLHPTGTPGRSFTFVRGSISKKQIVGTSKKNLVLIGEHVDSTITRYDDYAAAYTLENIFAAASNPAVTTNWVPDLENDLVCQAVRKYTFKFLDPVNVCAALTSLKADGKDVEGFHPDSSLIPAELPLMISVLRWTVRSIRPIFSASP